MTKNSFKNISSLQSNAFFYHRVILYFLHEVEAHSNHPALLEYMLQYCVITWKLFSVQSFVYWLTLHWGELYIFSSRVMRLQNSLQMWAPIFLPKLLRTKYVKLQFCYYYFEQSAVKIVLQKCNFSKSLFDQLHKNYENRLIFLHFTKCISRIIWDFWE